MTISAKHLLAAAAITTTLASGTADAASLSVDFQATLSSEQHPDYSGEGRFYHVSVNPNNPGIGSYAATIVGTNDPAPTYTHPFVLSDVLAYKAIGGTNNDISGISLSGGDAGRLQYDSDDTVFDGFGQNIMKFWDVTDPGSDIATSVDPFNAVADANPSGYRSLGGVNGTVDVTGLTSGSFYIFYASFNATPTVSVILKDTDGGAPDISIADAHLNGDFANRSEHYVAELGFTTDGVYDTIEFEFLANGVDYTGNGRGFSSLLIGSTGGPAIPGDTDGDGDVDDSDLGTSFSNYTGPGGTGKTVADGDTDGDGDVDDGDLGTSFSNYTGPLGPAVPEPTSLALLGLGGLLVARRRRA